MAEILNEAEKGKGSLQELLAVAEQVAEGLGYPNAGEWKLWLRDCFEPLKASDRSTLTMLTALELPLATTNYDELLEEATGLPPVTWLDSDRALRVLRGEERAILHLHGFWREARSVVLGMPAYEHVKAQELHQTIQKFLAAQRNLVFIGCEVGRDSLIQILACSSIG